MFIICLTLQNIYEKVSHNRNNISKCLSVMLILIADKFSVKNLYLFPLQLCVNILRLFIHVSIVFCEIILSYCGSCFVMVVKY